MAARATPPHRAPFARRDRAAARSPAARRRVARGAALGLWVRAVRVRQWPKNLLVFAAPAAGGVLLRSGVLGRVSVAALAFCLLSAGAYLLNDLRDAPRGPPPSGQAPSSDRVSGDRAFAGAGRRARVGHRPGWRSL